MKWNNFILWIALIVLLLFNKVSFAQLSKGGEPLSFSGTKLRDSVQTIRMFTVNVDSLKRADIEESSEGMPFRFGFAMNANYGLYNSGSWDTLPEGDKVWRLKIQSKGAFSINLIFDTFQLAAGSHLFVYNEDKSMVLGAFTADLNTTSSLPIW